MIIFMIKRKFVRFFNAVIRSKF